MWTSPTGRTYRCTPDGAELFDDLAAPPKPIRPRDYRKARARRIALARAGAPARKAANTETRWNNHGRAKEIDQRQWRNQTRFLLFLFKGRPSTSRACRWVNDPDEPENIGLHWRPPPPPELDPDEPPPF